MESPFYLYEEDGTALLGAAPEFFAFKGTDGQDRVPPDIVELGSGAYAFAPDASDYAIGTLYVVGLGVQKAFGILGNAWGFPVYADDGDLESGADPEFESYADLSGVEKTPPTVSNIGDGLFLFSPTPTDRLEGRTYKVATGFNPARWTGSIEPVSPPVVGNVFPTAGSVISASTPIAIEVTDTSGLERVLLLARMRAAGLFEVVHDGQSFSPRYATSERETISSGWRFRLRRSGGWQGSPELSVIARDTSGLENA